MSSLPALHRFEDVAETYDISLRVLKEQANARKFDHIRWGNNRYLTDAQLRALLRSRTVTSSVPATSAATAARLARRMKRTTNTKTQQRAAA